MSALNLPVRSPEPTLRHVLRHVNRTYMADIRLRFAAHGVTEADYLSMFALRRIPDMSSADLARWTGVTAQGANQVLKSLIKRGLVERHRSPAHGRILEARLTAHGERLIEECEQEANDLDAVMCAHLTAEEVAALEALLRKCAAGLGSPVSETMRPPGRLNTSGPA
jgi:DNA-binding MarR family transcriptional regulator